ncbi:MAG: DUF4199 domain-containing protein [bacterium]|nr:DUF4199 domain-containing protein [bacterium]
MKNIIWRYGTISGFLNAIYLVVFALVTKANPNFNHSLITGYAAMAVALSFIFVGVYQAKKQFPEQPFGFNKAFLTALLIALISSLFYTFTWLVVNQFIYPEFMTNYTQNQIINAQNSGMSVQNLETLRKEMDGYVQLYKNPFWVFIMTLTEILPLGFLLSLLAAAIFKKKNA